MKCRYRRNLSDLLLAENHTLLLKARVLSKAERDPAVRNHALRHYAAKCMACQFQPKVLSQLEVHHLDPVAEGVRKTRIEDVAVLCANCHRLAHSEDPPLTVEQLTLSATGKPTSQAQL